MSVEMKISTANYGITLQISSGQRMLLNVTCKDKATHPLARIISEKSFENVCNLRRTSLTSIAIDIRVLTDRETRFSKLPNLVTVESPWLIKSLELNDIVSRCWMT